MSASTPSQASVNPIQHSANPADSGKSAPDATTPAAPYSDGPRLLGDVGGTNARFALEHAPGQVGEIQTLNGADYPEFVLAVEDYLKIAGHPAIRHAAIAMANPVQGDQIKMTNHDWAFSIESTRKRLNLETLLIVNDFTALSMALPYLEGKDFEKIGGGQAQSGAVIGLVGPGTGLGVGGLIPDKGRWIALGSEGGHVAFAPSDPREAEVLAYYWRKYAHVSAERLVSGPGMETLYLALAEIGQHGQVDVLSAPQIVERAKSGGAGGDSDTLCRETLDCFCGMLGTAAANIALTLGALGGMYLGGGVVPHMGDYFATSPFRKRFESGGRFEAYLQKIPTYVITAPYPAFAGSAAILAEHLGNAGCDENGKKIPFIHKASAKAG